MTRFVKYLDRQYLWRKSHRNMAFRLAIVTPLCYICTNNKEKGKTMEHITEDGIVYNMDDLYCPECGDVYAPTVGYCDATLRCTGVALLPVDQMF